MITRVCPHARLSLMHTVAGRTQGLLVCQGGETRLGTPPCLGPCPLRLPGPHPPHPWGTWTFSRMDVSLEPLLQCGFSPPPSLFFPYPRRQPGPCPSESLSSGFPAGYNRLLPAGPSVTCSFRFTLDPKNPLPPAPRTEAPQPERDSGDLGRARQNGLSGQQRLHGPHQHCPAASLKTPGRGRPPACTATVVGAWPTPSALRPRSGQTTRPGSTPPQQSLIPDSSEYSAFSGQVSSLTSYIYIWSHHAACGILVP